MKLSSALLRRKIIEMEGRIFKIKRFSVHDGPGIRTAVFMKGCPLNCIWCHSPEGIGSEISIWWDNSLCIACGECVKVCKKQALELASGQIIIDRRLCTLNGDCVTICPTAALQYTGYFMTVDEISEEVEKDILYFRQSGGGVTLTGGEPLYQPEFTREILISCREKGINTAIETSLFCEREAIKSIADYVDLFITDLKIYDQVQHIRYTGKPNEVIKENFSYLAESGKQIIVRIPMVEGITDTKENKNSIAEFVGDIDSRIPIEYIAFNPLAENNYKRLGIPFLLK